MRKLISPAAFDRHSFLKTAGAFGSAAPLGALSATSLNPSDRSRSAWNSVNRHTALVLSSRKPNWTAMASPIERRISGPRFKPIVEA